MCVNPFAKFSDTDQLLWHTDLKPHVSGDFSFAVVQANSELEDQGQVFTSPSTTYIGVFDGHGGPQASRFVNRHLFPFIDKYAKQEGRMCVDVIKKAFNATEEGFLRVVKQSRPEMTKVGSCCLVGVISNDELYVANLGDSRVVLGKKVVEKGKSRVVVERLSSDHNVSLVEVRKEVEAQHPGDAHIVVYCHGGWRIKGIIQVSRSIGDFYLKKPEFNRDPYLMQYGNHIPLKRPVLTAEPSIVSRKLTPQDLFLIFASDGLWDHLSDEEAVGLVRNHPRRGIAKRLVEAAIDKATKKRELRYNDIKKINKGNRRRVHDDITVIVIYLDQHKRLANGTKLGCTSAPVDIFSCKEDKNTRLVQHP
ncbi:hypothetical protein QVD17_14602 [Tagetes erecta]|uniref:protein-serine/threonine phosphatase n=1 Tax=Tagetes erecta TaxID=13708 RepID=A0AAD8L3H2_TARER|nr:hypothetical protein QVD17_14602 [Tagetes erecta]